MRQAPVHYLRQNEAEWTPAACIFLDTETQVIPGTEPQVLALKLWCATFTDRRNANSRKPATVTGRGHTAAELAAWVDARTAGQRAVWCFAHNLGFDLTSTRLPIALQRRGWVPTDFALTTDTPWLRMSKGSKVLTFTDSMSWLPRALADIGAMVAIPKPPLPAEADDEADWWARCEGDVAILAAAMGQLMDWWDANRLGHWSITGNSCGFNAMRHKMPAKSMTIDPDPVKAEWERAAVYGGRRETMRITSWDDAPVAEVDFTGAYPTVAANLVLPAKRLAPFASLDVDDIRLRSPNLGVIADVVVETDVPRWPLRTPRGVLYPTGVFATRLAGPDITEARTLGRLRSVGAGFTYTLGPALMPWARWVLDIIAGVTPDTPEVARVAAKHWSRSVIGKMAARAPVTTRLGPAIHHDWHIEHGWDAEHNAPGTLIDFAGRRWWSSKHGTPDNCFPAVLAWVESTVRVALGRAIDTLGRAAVLACDTDGMTVDARHLPPDDLGDRPIMDLYVSDRHLMQRAIDRANERTVPLSLRIKAEHRSGQILGPQHVIYGGERRFAGLSRKAHDLGGGRFIVRQWPGLAWQLSNGDRRGYVRPLLTSRVVGPFPTGWLTTDGRVWPARAYIDAQGATQLAGPADTDIGGAAALADVQHPTLAAVLARVGLAALTPLLADPLYPDHRDD